MRNRLTVHKIESVGLVDDGDDPEAQVLFWKRKFTAGEREAAAGAGEAMPTGGFPIKTRQDLLNAIRAVGRAKNPVAARAHILRRARALGLTDLIPDGWRGGKERPERPEVSKEQPMSDFDITALGLSDEETEALDAHIATLVDEAVAAATAPTDEDGEALSEKLRKRLPQEVSDHIAKLSARADEADERLAREITKRRDAEWIAKAKALPLGPADEAGPVLRQLHDAAPEATETLVKRIEALAEVVRLENLFIEKGSSEEDAPTADRREAFVKQYRGDNPDASVEQARAAFWRANPDLEEVDA